MLAGGGGLMVPAASTVAGDGSHAHHGEGSAIPWWETGEAACQEGSGSGWR